jgi:Methyltransferase domain
LRPIADIFRSHASFDADGRHTYGTDRESNHHYGAAYESLFPDRSAVKLMLEIGVADGASLIAWREVFPNAHIVGMDLVPAEQTLNYRIEFHLGDQRLRADCERVAAGRQFDLIVDDASHDPASVLVSLLWLWGFVAPSGLYVVEDFVGDVVLKMLDLFHNAETVDTVGPFGGHEPLIVLRRRPL